MRVWAAIVLGRWKAAGRSIIVCTSLPGGGPCGSSPVAALGEVDVWVGQDVGKNRSMSQAVPQGSLIVRDRREDDIRACEQLAEATHLHDRYPAYLGDSARKVTSSVSSETIRGYPAQ